MISYSNCLYAMDGIIDTILNWKDTAPDKYLELTHLLARGDRQPFAEVGTMVLPEHIYTTKVACSCPIEYGVKTTAHYFGGQLEFPTVDFRAAISRVERLCSFEEYELQTTA